MDLDTVVDDLGPATQESCPTCGSNDYIVEGGFYYCSVCNTQSQVSRLYVDEDFRQELQTRTHVAVLRRDKRKKVAKTDTRRLLSTWEIWNVVLRSMADSLIEIGFPEYVRDKICQLYVTFMMKREVIFVSTSNPKEKSRVTLGEPKTNLYALNGIHRRKRGKIRRNPSLLKKKVAVVGGKKDEAYSNRILKGLKTKSKRKAIEKEYQEKETLDVDEHEFENIIQTETGTKSKKDASDDVRKQREPMSIYTKLTKKVTKNTILTGGKVKAAQLFRYKKKKLNPVIRAHRKSVKVMRFEAFTLNTCLITVFVALRELGFPVVMTDILRLNIVGILRVDNIKDVIKQFEEYQDTQSVQPLMFKPCLLISLHRVGEDIQSFVEYMDIKKFHCPQMKEIVPKYIDEFVLPREFECLINMINHMLSLDDYVNDFPKGMCMEHFRATPEVIVVAQFIVVLKMLFGLDDITERYQSNFARLVNKVVKEERDKRKAKMDDWTELFVIEDWFGYLQRRKDLVRRELCSPTIYTPNKPPGIRKLNSLIATLEKTTMSDNALDNPDENDNSAGAAQVRAAESCKTLFDTILKGTLPKFEGCEEIPILKPYIPLPLPTESIVQQYVERYPAVADTSVEPELLQANFVQKRIDFIWNPKKYVKILKLFGYKVKVIHGDAVNNYPIEDTEGVAKSKIVHVFQPYKSFDEFVGQTWEDCSSSMKFLLGICEDILPRMRRTHVNVQPLETKRRGPNLQQLVNGVGDLYIKRVLSELIPIMTKWNDSDSNSDSD